MGYKSPARTNSAQHNEHPHTHTYRYNGYTSPSRTNSAQYTNKEQTTIKSGLTPLSRARCRSLLEEFAPGRDRDTKLTAVLCCSCICCAAVDCSAAAAAAHVFGVSVVSGCSAHRRSHQCQTVTRNFCLDGVNVAGRES